MKDFIRTILLIVAIYSGAIALDSHGYANNIWALLCVISCSVFVSMKDKKKD